MISLPDQLGFTLVELIIVIVILGILAGATISVLKPKTQQDRANDAVVREAVGKVALAANGRVALTGAAPDGATFFSNVSYVTAGGAVANNCGLNSDSCYFNLNIVKINLPATCQAGALNYYGDSTGTTQCLFRYVRDSVVGTSRFRVYGKSFEDPNITFVYDTNTQGISNCKQADIPPGAGYVPGC